MGKFMILPGLNFASAGMGKVTPIIHIPVTGLSILGDDSFLGNENVATFQVSYEPYNTDERGVTWSITSGSQHATITEEGVLSILDGASSSAVTIRATSSVRPSVFSEKAITVTYRAAAPEPVHTGSTYYIPLLKNSTPKEGVLTATKEDCTYDPEKGAIFGDNKGIVYAIPAGQKFTAVAFDIYFDESTGSQNYQFLVWSGTYNGSSGGHGINLFKVKDGAFGSTTSSGTDKMTAGTFTQKEWHRVCLGIDSSNNIQFCVDGTRVGWLSGYATGSDALVLGNNWRYKVGSGDRGIGAFMRNVAIWTDTLTLEEMESYSVMAE